MFTPFLLPRHIRSFGLALCAFALPVFSVRSFYIPSVSRDATSGRSLRHRDRRLSCPRRAPCSAILVRSAHAWKPQLHHVHAREISAVRDAPCQLLCGQRRPNAVPWVVAGVGERVGLARQGFARPKGIMNQPVGSLALIAAAWAPCPTATRNSFWPVCASPSPVVSPIPSFPCAVNHGLRQGQLGEVQRPSQSSVCIGVAC